MPTLDPFASLPRRATPSLISASLVLCAETSLLLVEADATVSMESKTIIPTTSRKTILLNCLSIHNDLAHTCSLYTVHWACNMKIIHYKLMIIEVANALKSILKIPLVVLAVLLVNFRNSVTSLLSHGEDVGTRHNQLRDCFNDRC